MPLLYTYLVTATRPKGAQLLPAPVRFDGLQQTTRGEREIKKALRSTLLKCQLHRDQGLFDRAYE